MLWLMMTAVAGLVTVFGDFFVPDITCCCEINGGGCEKSYCCVAAVCVFGSSKVKDRWRQVCHDGGGLELLRGNSIIVVVDLCKCEIE